MNAPQIINIQRYSIHDGHGIRTTAFFKGCPLRCVWCHNPESQRYKPELLFSAEKCGLCGACVRECPQGAISTDEVNRCAYTDRNKCVSCGICADVCLNGAREMAGREYTPRELVKELAKDRMFFEESGGGVTLSGGEVLAQDMDYVAEVCERLTGMGIGLNIDTCGHVPYEHIQRVLPYTDVFLYDLKCMDDARHREYTGVGNALILENLVRLAKDGGRISIRMPLCAGVNDGDADIRAIAEFLRENAISPVSIHLLAYHDTGSGKYKKLGERYGGAELRAPDAKRLGEITALFGEYGFGNVKIGG